MYICSNTLEMVGFVCEVDYASESRCPAADPMD